MCQKRRNILKFFLLAICCFVFSVNVYAAEGVVTVSIVKSEGEPDYYSPGDTVNLDFMIEDTVAFNNGELFLALDETTFDAAKDSVTIVAGEMFADYLTRCKYTSTELVPHLIGVTTPSSEPMPEGLSGVFFKLSIPIKEDAANGTYTIGFNNELTTNGASRPCYLGLTQSGTTTHWEVSNGGLVLNSCTITIGEPASGGDDGDDTSTEDPVVTTGYTADFTTSEQNVLPGQNVSATVEIGVGTEETATAYNAMQMSFSYNPALLTYKDYSSEVPDIEVEDAKDESGASTGTITVTRYGDAVSLGDALTLNFVSALDATGTATITLDSANIDISDNANEDAPAATITTGTHTVTFDEAKTYNVTLNGEDVTGAATANEGVAYTFTVDKKDGYDYTVSVMVNGSDVSAQVTNDGNTYTIPAALIAGDIEVTVTKTAIKQTINVNTGSANGAATATQGEDYTFTINKEEGKEYTVTVTDGAGNAVPFTENADGSYTIKADDIPADELNIEVTEKEPESTLSVEVTEYLKLGDASSIWLVTATDELAEGNNALAYNTDAMYYSDNYEAYCYLVISGDTAENVLATAQSVVAQTTETAKTLAYDKDVNRTGKVDINDAQMTYNMYNTVYGDFNTATMQMFLEADVTADKTVDVQDATAIVAAIR